MASISSVLCAWLTSKKWLSRRKFAALASPIAYAVVGVHGKSGVPSSDVKIGPCSEEYSVRERGSSEPSARRACTVTTCLRIWRGCPSTR
jgi:hypothetical protein